MNEVEWWQQQYALTASGGEVNRLARPWIDRWPELATCDACGKQLGANGDRRSRHRCRDAVIR